MVRLLVQWGVAHSLSPWYEKGGIEPEDENDKAIFEGRFNLGVVSFIFQ